MKYRELSQLHNIKQHKTLRQKYPYSEFLVRIFSHSEWIRKDTEYSLRMRENTDHKNSEYRHFSRSENVSLFP